MLFRADNGVYFLKATNIEKYEQIKPFLISIPTFNEEEGKMNYDITVIPKHEPEVTTDFPGKPEVPQTGLDSPILKYFAGGSCNYSSFTCIQYQR